MAATETAARGAETAMRGWDYYESVFEDIEAPFALVDLEALDASAPERRGRPRAKPVRVASKSVRCRPLLADVAGRPGFEGLMTFTLRGALWVGEHGVPRPLVGL